MLGIKDIEVFSYSRNSLGESPRWHPSENRLYWTDIDTGTILRQAPRETLPFTIPLGVKVGCLGFRKSGGLILAASTGYLFWQADVQPTSIIGNPEPGKIGARFNDGLVDAYGRFWAGTMTETGATSSLYRLDPDHSIHRMLSGVTISNGIGWNKENTRFYFTDTNKRMIRQYDYNLEQGALTYDCLFAAIDGPGVPDGLAIDSEGNIWSVHCGSGKLVIYDPHGRDLGEIPFPTRCITACTFGGPDLSDLYVTSSRSLLHPSEIPEQPLAGAVFKISTKSQGIPSNFYTG